MIDDQLSQQLKAKRIASSLTQQQLADRLNVSRKTVSGWETGRSLPDIDTLRQIARIYKVSLDQLVSDPQQLESKEMMAQPQLSSIHRLTNNILIIILAVLVAERVTQYAIRAAFLYMDVLIVLILGLRIAISKYGIKRVNPLKSPAFLSGYALFTLAAIVGAITYLFNMGFGFQYGIGFSGYLALFNLFLIWHHRNE
ncbi:helix-turn-helix domain-containing protein [Lentilactobacillus kisonensis]|uniref:DNA-binding helix-turn-helix protein n=1 Tax=Lentilactobacillus kisonensis F0435 TaxID=797516 RepID=H1LKA1_9LACO|nr:helix-turn-helix transcriptional regulator [Lentilactobacillus kisonensis]EHO47575.1 DNA-binding helix-turn-helix protein [Lentilactobacillus kisonensis F0435]